jgi:hypothetical protein
VIKFGRLPLVTKTLTGGREDRKREELCLLRRNKGAARGSSLFLPTSPPPVMLLEVKAVRKKALLIASIFCI